MDKDIALTDIVELDCWRRIQDHFAEVLGVTIRTVNKTGNLIAPPSNPTRICEEILTSSPAGIVKCEKCLPPSFPDLSQRERWQEGYQCYLGLNNFCIPVNISGAHVIAYILIGPVFLGKRREAQGYKQRAEELGIDLDRLIDCLTEIKLFTFTGIQSLIELISDIVSNVAQLGYSRFKLERLIPLPKISKIVHKFHMEKILSALLDVSFHTTRAEFGSIMLLDEETGELYIKIAKGLKNDIIKNARLKIGEGIAGLAVQERRFLLLDDKLTDERIRSRLKRPEVKSAVVAPLRVKDQPLGVMNIGTSNPSDKITPENVETLHRLIELTEASLSDLIKL